MNEREREHRFVPPTHTSHLSKMHLRYVTDLKRNKEIKVECAV